MGTGGGLFCAVSVAAAAVLAVPAAAQTLGPSAHAVPNAWRNTIITFEGAGGAEFDVAPEARFGGDFRLGDRAFSPNRGGRVVEAWRDTDSGAVERLRLSRSGDWLRADGAPLPPVPGDRTAFEGDGYRLSYTRGWPTRSYDPATGLQVEVIPHAGFGVGDDGGSAEAGATIRIGSGLDRLVPEGSNAFDEDQGRWYVFAAGSSRAVGYNFARNRDGNYVRSGMSHDSGAFIGDAQVGVAWRRGDLQTSFGYVYREHEVEGLYGDDFERERSEGVVAFQMSIRPDW